MSKEQKHSGGQQKAQPPAKGNQVRTDEQHSKDGVEPIAPSKTPDHEQGREYKPHVVAQKAPEGAQGPSGQSHRATEPSERAEKPGTDVESGDTERTVAEGGNDHKAAASVKPMAGNKTGAKP